MEAVPGSVGNVGVTSGAVGAGPNPHYSHSHSHSQPHRASHTHPYHQVRTHIIKISLIVLFFYTSLLLQY